MIYEKKTTANRQPMQLQNKPFTTRRKLEVHVEARFYIVVYIAQAFRDP